MDTSVLVNMFHLGLPVLEKILRPILVYFFLVIAFRLAGKRELAQLNAFDLVVLLTIANAVQNAIIGDDNSVSGGVIGAITLLVLNYVVVRFLYGHQGLEQLIEGSATVLIDASKILPEALKQELITVHELEAAAHKQGFAGLDDIERAVLETSGSISFIAHQPSAETTRHQELMARLDVLTAQVAALRDSSRP